MPFGIEKLGWCDYPTVKKFEDMLICFDRMYKRDRQTDRHRMTAQTALAKHRTAKSLKVIIMVT